MIVIKPYDRERAVEYALTWALDRNPLFLNFTGRGGDCTNFASQCLYAGTGVMNYTPTFGWYYIDANNKSPSWTGVPYFYNFMTRDKRSPGPFGTKLSAENINLLMPGDFVQLRFTKNEFEHTPIIVEIRTPLSLDNILIAAHSNDADYRPLSTYNFKELRFIHIFGAYPPAPSANMEAGQ